MSTYRLSNRHYRKIYENHYGPIPKDSDGRSYDIHHIDGNHNNNDPSNLKAVTLLEHYNIHYDQEDWGACLLLKKRLKISVSDQSNLQSKLGQLNSRDQVAKGTHPWLGGDIQRKTARRLVKEGTHHLLGSDHAIERLKNGTHPSQTMISCLCCQKTIDIPNFTRWHGSKCKLK